ncbi:hypothetical protein V5O48_012199 [Marasmius crinis-equi]|uniref:Uncharacterized protein n=1 Tax=Marasmius crinis-equi TaxID=585013 RepID=A0ABR3F3H1_9AGAR
MIHRVMIKVSVSVVKKKKEKSGGEFVKMVNKRATYENRAKCTNDPTLLRYNTPATTLSLSLLLPRPSTLHFTTSGAVLGIPPANTQPDEPPFLLERVVLGGCTWTEGRMERWTIVGIGVGVGAGWASGGEEGVVPVGVEDGGEVCKL